MVNLDILGQDASRRGGEKEPRVRRNKDRADARGHFSVAEAVREHLPPLGRHGGKTGRRRTVIPGADATHPALKGPSESARELPIRGT